MHTIDIVGVTVVLIVGIGVIFALFVSWFETPIPHIYKLITKLPSIFFTSSHYKMMVDRSKTILDKKHPNRSKEEQEKASRDLTYRTRNPLPSGGG